MRQHSSVEQLQEQLSQLPDQQSLVALFVSQEGPVATVDQGGSRLRVKAATMPIVPGDAVRLERRNGELVVTGPVAPRATTGRVTATGAMTTVEYPNGSGVTAQLRRISSYTPAVGDIVMLDWSAGGAIVGKIDAAPVVKPPEAPPAPATRRYDQVFTALDSGSYQAGYGWRTNDVWSSASNVGAWFYGTKINDTIPDGATILAAELYLPLLQNVGAAPFGLHGNPYRPGGAPDYFNITNLGASRSGWIGLAPSYLDYLKVYPGGFGFALGGYNIWAGLQKDGQSGAVHVIYEA